MQNNLEEALAEPYFTNEEVEWVKSTFKGNRFALKTLRKFLIPTLNNHAPIGNLQDMWFEDVETLSRMAPSDREMIILAKIKTIKHIENVLSQLRLYAEVEEETEDEKNTRRKKDSTK